MLGAVLLVVLAGIGAWSLSDPGSHGRSRNGCINVTMPSSTGGGQIHACGGKARALCRDAFAHDDRLAMLTRVQCRKAGLG